MAANPTRVLGGAGVPWTPETTALVSNAWLAGGEGLLTWQTCTPKDIVVRIERDADDKHASPVSSSLQAYDSVPHWRRILQEGFTVARVSCSKGAR